MTQWSNICILIIILLCVKAELDRRRAKDDLKTLISVDKNNQFMWLLLMFVLILSRLVGLGVIPGGINQDEAMSAVDALSLSKYGTDRFGTWLPAHFTAWGYGQMSVLLAYITAPFIKIFGFSTFIVRLPMVLASVAGAIALWKLAELIFGEKAAFITFLFTIINPWHFMQSRWAIDCNLFPHIFIIGLCLLAYSLKKEKYLYISMIFFALCMYSYGVSFYMVPLFLLASCICLICYKKVTVKQCLISALIYFGISFPIYGTMLINFMKWKTVKLPFTTMLYFENNTRSSDILFFSEKPFAQLENNIRSLIRTAFLQTPDHPWNAIDDFGTMYKFVIPFIVVGIIVTFYIAIKGKEEQTKILCRLLLIYWACSVTLGICINNVNINRINIIFYSHIIFAGVGIFYIVKKWKVAVAIVTAILMISSTLFLQRYFTVWSNQIDGFFFKDFVEAVDFAGNQNCDYYYITPDTQYENSSNVTEILTLYTLKMDAKYFQGTTNEFNEKEISYRDRFHYENVPSENLNNWDNTCYIFRTENVRSYHEDAFKIKNFGEYSVAIPNQNANF